MKNPVAVVFVLALAAVAVGCGGPTPEKVCAQYKSLEAYPPGCEATWTAKKTATPDVFKKQAACVFDAKTGAEAAACTKN